MIPKFELKSNLRFKVVKKPGAMEAVEGIFESKEMRVLTKMMLAEATDSQKADKMKEILSEEEQSILPTLIDRGYVNCINGRYYLSKRGQSLGSMGIRKIVELDIPLPWEKRIEGTHPEARLSWIRPKPMGIRPLSNIPPTLYPLRSDIVSRNVQLPEGLKWVA